MRTSDASTRLERRPVRPLAGVAAAAVFALLAACQHGGGVTRERLDEKSGVTVRADAQPLVFARTETRYSRSARDYVYLGPVETNRQGVREYYVWVGGGSTLDRGYIAPESTVPERVFIDVADAPMELVLRPWKEREPTLGQARVYGTAVKLTQELAARVTLDQLRLLSREPLRSLRVVDHEGNARAYFRWEDGNGWQGFLAEVGGGAR